MAYRLGAEEELAEGARRIAGEQLDHAIGRLEGVVDDGSLGGRAHEARKSLKKARAVIRLLRAELGEERFATDNRRLRDAGRQLAPFRDAEVVATTLGRLEQAAPELTAALADERARAREELLAGAIAERALGEVRAGRAAVDAWSIGYSDSGAFTPALRRTLKRGRKAFRRAYESPSPARFHELRKRVKELWYFGRILAPRAPLQLERLVALSDGAADRLGADHDLALLADRIKQLGERAGESRLRARLLAEISERRAGLEQQARPALAELLEGKPRRRALRIGAGFDAGRTAGAA